jgi:hypothetical protein
VLAPRRGEEEIVRDREARDVVRDVLDKVHTQSGIRRDVGVTRSPRDRVLVRLSEILTLKPKP